MFRARCHFICVQETEIDTAYLAASVWEEPAETMSTAGRSHLQTECIHLLLCGREYLRRPHAPWAPPAHTCVFVCTSPPSGQGRDPQCERQWALTWPLNTDPLQSQGQELTPHCCQSRLGNEQPFSTGQGGALSVTCHWYNEKKNKRVLQTDNILWHI